MKGDKAGNSVLLGGCGRVAGHRDSPVEVGFGVVANGENGPSRCREVAVVLSWRGETQRAEMRLCSTVPCTGAAAEAIKTTRAGLGGGR